MPDYATFGEMLLIGLSEANKFLEETHSEMRFKESTELGEDVYCIFSARKKNGKPKEGEPDWHVSQKINAVNASNNLYSVEFSDEAVYS